jgi:hypothetical protein
MKLDANIKSMLTALAAVATTLTASQTIAEPWKTVAQMVVVFVAALVYPKKP